MHSGYEICSILFVAATSYHHQSLKKSTKLAKVGKTIVKKLSKSCQKVVKNFVSPGKNQK
jgi:hypothetical protein